MIDDGTLLPPEVPPRDVEVVSWSRSVRGPLVAWVILPAALTAATVPVLPDLWWVVAGLVGAVCLVIGLLLSAPSWRRMALLVGGIMLGLSYGTVTWPGSAPAQLIEVTGTVATVQRQSWTQRVRLRGVYGPAAVTSSGMVTVEAPPTPALHVGDTIQARGLWTDNEYGGAVKATQVTMQELREQSLRAPAYAAIDTLGPHRELASSLLLGAGSPVERRTFRNAGLAHVLAVSGLHLGIAAGCAWFVLRMWHCVWWLRLVTLLGFVLGYGWFTGGAPATIRAAAMVVVTTAALLSQREPHRLGILAMAMVIVLGWQPAMVHHLGFQLSALAVFGIMTLGRAWVRWRARILPLQPWPLDRWAWRLGLASLRTCCDGLAIGVAATLVLSPLVAQIFGVMHPWSAVATVFMAPLVTLILWVGLPWLTLHMLWPHGPWAAGAAILDAALAGADSVASWAAAWPAAVVSVVAPPWSLTAVVCVLCLPWPIAGQVRWRLMGGLAAVVWWVSYAIS